MADTDRRYTITFDGGSRGNPGEGYGSYLIERTGVAEKVMESVSFGFRDTTNNEAEYLTLIQALHRLHDNSAPNKRGRYRVVLVGDSRLVLNQVDGSWAANKQELRSLCFAAQSLLRPFAGFTVMWVPREKMVALFGH